MGLPAALNGPVLLSKGPSDLICWPGGAAPVAQSDQAALRRCGGQGDVLAGVVLLLLMRMLMWMLLAAADADAGCIVASAPAIAKFVA